MSPANSWSCPDQLWIGDPCPAASKSMRENSSIFSLISLLKRSVRWWLRKARRFWRSIGISSCRAPDSKYYWAGEFCDAKLKGFSLLLISCQKLPETAFHYCRYTARSRTRKNKVAWWYKRPGSWLKVDGCSLNWWLKNFRL